MHANEVAGGEAKCSYDHGVSTMQNKRPRSVQKSVLLMVSAAFVSAHIRPLDSLRRHQAPQIFPELCGAREVRVLDDIHVRCLSNHPTA